MAAARPDETDGTHNLPGRLTSPTEAAGYRLPVNPPARLRMGGVEQGPRDAWRCQRGPCAACRSLWVMSALDEPLMC